MPVTSPGGFAVCVGETGRNRIGNGGVNRRDGIAGGVVAGLRHRGCDADHQIDRLGGELRGNLLGDTHIRLRVLIDNGQIVTLDQSGFR